MADTNLFPPSLSYSILLERGENPMTMQVGMAGSDGVLIASDTQWTDNRVPLRTSRNLSKFKISHEHGLAIACAGGMVTAEHLADEIIAAYARDESWSSSEAYARPTMVERVLAKAGDARRDAECIVARSGATPSLSYFGIAASSGCFMPRSGCEQRSKVVAGDPNNSAIFWAERYYPRLPKLPIAQLIPLAAHLIVVARHLGSGIGGLEIVLCDAEGIRVLPKESADKLEKWSNNLDKRIHDDLFGGPQLSQLDLS